MKKYPRPRKIFSKSALTETWKMSRSKVKKKSRGIDLQSKQEFEENLPRNLSELSRELIEGYYRPALLLPKALPKPNSSKKRIICIPTIRDRLAQRTALAYIMRENKLGLSGRISFGVTREDGGVAAAIKQARKYRRNNLWAVKTDVSSFFDKINRELLISDLEKKLSRSSLVPFLSKVVCTEVDQSEEYIRRELEINGVVSGQGLRQGMPLSPILSNFVLRRFDAYFHKRQIKMIRYADDLIAFGSTENEVLSIFTLISEQLEKLDLVVPSFDESEKSKIVSPGDDVDFLGYVMSGKSDDFRVRIPKEARHIVRDRLREFSSFDSAFHACRHLSVVLQKIENIKSGYLHTYDVAMKSERANFSAYVHNECDNTIRSLFNDTFGKKFLDESGGKKREFLGVN